MAINDNKTYISERKHGPKVVGKYDPRRALPGYEHRAPISPSDVAKAGVEYYFKTQLPESEARERVTLASSPNSIVKKARQTFPEYDDLDDITFMEGVTSTYPEYTDVLDDLKVKRQELYKTIDRIEFKLSIGGTLTPKETFINALALPEDNNRIEQQLFASYTNAASWGLQDYLLNRMGFDRSTPETGKEAVAAGIGTLAGFIQSPIKAASKILTSIPGLARIFSPINAASKAQKILKPLLRGGLKLGVANALMIPEEAHKYGILQAGDRIQSFGGGMMFGTGLGALGYIPSKAARMISSSLFMGVPSTLREDSLEEQVFNYGYGAYAGIHGVREMIRSEDILRKTIEKGVIEPRAQKELLKRSDDILREFEVLAGQEGSTYTSVINMGRKHYIPVYKGWRKGTMKEIRMRIKQLKSDPSHHLRNDKISNLFEEMKGTKLDNLTDAQLFNIHEHIRPENTPLAPTGQFISAPPFRPEYKGVIARQRQISLFHKALRLGYQSLEHLGFGGMFEEGLTGNVVKSDVKASKLMLLHRQLTNTWKQTVGMNKETARRIFLHRDGKLDLESLAKNHPQYSKELRVSKQMGRYLDTLLNLQNRHRAKYGQKPIKPLENYITHIFDTIRSQTLAEKYPFPDYISDIVEFIPPKEGRQPYLKPRRGAKRYKENVWSALDAYGYRANDYVSDDGLRQANRVMKWLSSEIKVNERTGKESPVDLLGVKKNVRSWADLYAGRPGKFDTWIKEATGRLPVVGPYLSNLERVGGVWRTLLYTGYMGWRPKLALRNLGQHSLIFGEVGAKPLWKAITTRNRDEVKNLLNYSEVLKTRELGFAPEIPYGFTPDKMEALRRSAFYMFRTADRINVEDAFMGGFYEVSGGKMLRSGTDLFKRAVKRGDQVAAMTQFMYTKGNRGPISNLWGMSHTMGKFASMFTTWPINKIELDIAWSKPENRVKMMRWMGLVGVGALASVASNGQIRTSAYTGAGAELQLWRKIKDGVVGIRALPLVPKLMIGEDLRKALGDDDLWKLILYDVKENAPLWEKF